MLQIPPRSLKTLKHRAVFFDAGDTLYAIRNSVGSVYASVAGRFGVRFSAQEAERNFQASWRILDGGGKLVPPSREKAWWRRLVKRVVDALGGVPDFPSYFEALYDEFAQARPWKLFPEVKKVLAHCRRRGVKTGIVSNWDSRLPLICDQLGLTPHVDFILASALVKSAKPDPKIFRLALARAGVRPHEALHVGDSLEHDVKGAWAAGLDALLLNRKGLPHQAIVAEADTLRAVLELC